MTGEAIKLFLHSKKMQVSLPVVSRLTCKVEDMIRGEITESYQKLEAYFIKMEEKNPGSICRFEKNQENLFHRACFIPSVGIHIAKNAKRLFGFDEAHLKGDMNKRGVYLVATAKDYDTHVTPFALILVPVENYDNWSWFLEVVQEALESLVEFTVLSDRQKGLLSAVAQTLPKAGHRFCLHHIKTNIISNGVALSNEEKNTITKVAKNDSENDFEYFRLELKQVRPSAVEYLDKIERKHWVRYMFFETFKMPTYDETTSNLSEQANNWLGNAYRSAKPLDAFAMYFCKLASLISARRQAIGKLLRSGDETQLVPGVNDEYQARLQLLDYCDGDSCLGSAYQITYIASDPWPVRVQMWRSVDLPGKECTCGNWTDTKFPCVHAIKAAELQGIPIHTLYDEARLSVGHLKHTYYFPFCPWPTDVVLVQDTTLRVPQI